MNYKILALSAVIGVGLIAVGLMEAQQAPPTKVADRMAAMNIDVEAPAPMSPSGYPAAPAMAAREMPMDDALAEPAISPIDASLPAGDIPVGLPQIAYIYSHGFRLPGPRIPALQQRHADLCESKGPETCRIIAMDQTGGEGEYAAGMLQLAVASDEARAFGKQLVTIAEGAEGEQVSAAISGEDLSKRIVDTEARLRAHTLLRDRLMEILATRRGTVPELVAAERGVAQVNEEIDQARSWLSEMKGRVAFSRLDISYESAQPAEGGFMEPVRGAFGSLGKIFGSLLAVLIVLGAVAAPLLAGLLGFRILWRRFGWLNPKPDAMA